MNFWAAGESDLEVSVIPVCTEITVNGSVCQGLFFKVVREHGRSSGNAYLPIGVAQTANREIGDPGFHPSEL